MKPLLLILSLFIFHLATAQDSALIIKRTDSIVTSIDKATGITRQFRGRGFQVYEYKMIADTVAKITLSAKQGPKQVKHTFYQYHGSLLFATESETSYYFNKDSIGWGGTYYFNKGSLLYYETLGHGKSETEEWDPQKEVLATWQKAKTAVLNHLKRRTNPISREAP